MTTARTQRFHVSRGGAARPRVTESKPDGFTPVSAETFEGVSFTPSALDFDPADYNVDDVNAYVEEHPEHAEEILDLELAGKARTGVLSFVENFVSESE